MLDVIPSQRCSYVLEPIRVRINSEYLSCCTVPVAFVERIVDNYIFFSEQATSPNFSTNSPFENVFLRLAIASATTKLIFAASEFFLAI